MNGKLMGAMGGVFLYLTVAVYAQSLTQVGFVSANSPALGVQAQGNYLYFAEFGGSSGVFRSVDVSDPANPVALASFATPGLITDVWVQEFFQGTFAFLGMADTEAGIRVMDVTNPAIPQQVLFYASGESSGFFYDGAYLYVADGGGLRVFEFVFNPPALVPIWSFNVANSDGIATFVTDQWVLLTADGIGLYVINKNSHQLESIISLSHVGLGVAARGNIAFVSSVPEGLISIDLTDPQAPVPLDTLPGNTVLATGLTPAGDYLYFADGDNGLRVIDVSNPSALQEVDAFAPQNIFALVSVQQDSLLYVASGDVVGNGAANGVFILEGVPTAIPPSPEEIARGFVLEQNFPNPFNPETSITFQLNRSGRITLIIYDVLGQPVKTLVDAYRHAGSYTVRWDGTDDHGAPLSTGVYFYRLKMGTGVATRKMILLR